MSEDSVVLNQVTKVFESGSSAEEDLAAVQELSLNIRQGEFFTLLGPSGCGKTTTLRMIAGFETPTSGDIFIGRQRVNDVPPYHRPVNTVFQNYALFPHLTVAENIAFGLTMKRLPKDEITRRTRKALSMVQLPDLGERKPRQLSGGQQQRVALARALVNEPKVLLLDEPLGALDLKLRKEMQFELKHLQSEIDITFIYVTHDQEEALTMSDRIAVLNQGLLLQVDTPVNVYEKPATRFVAEFIGRTNFLPGRVLAVNNGTAEIELAGQSLLLPTDQSYNTGKEVTVAVRPEKLRLNGLGHAKNLDEKFVIQGTVRESVYAGTDTQYIIGLESGERLTVHVRNSQALPSDEFARGRRVSLSCPVEALRLLPE
ncbi:MAG: ABC transporter ATP-binding protein [Anaerolineaceae bacterium]|jgi:spermidine/putrescine transport system ATP-binding protein|nr:ABC transporter ATP-binding protein [Anaerolineaceae bacterium]